MQPDLQIAQVLGAFALYRLDAYRDGRHTGNALLRAGGKKVRRQTERRRLLNKKFPERVVFWKQPHTF